MSLTLFVHRLRNIHLDKAKVGLVPVSSKLRFGTQPVASCRHNPVTSVRIQHQHVDHTTANQSCSTHYENRLPIETLQVEPFIEEAVYIFPVYCFSDITK